MKMKMEDGMLYIAAMDSTQFQIIKSWSLMRWNRSMQWEEGQISLELLNKLASIVKLPENIEAERRRLTEIQDAVDRERLLEEPKPLCSIPVKIPLFSHQIRAVNMALVTFGVVDPKDVPEYKKPELEQYETVQESLDRWFRYVEGDDYAFSDIPTGGKTDEE